jgi:PAS domain S-box-containing protein
MGTGLLITIISPDDHLAARLATILPPEQGQTRRFSTWEACMASPSGSNEEVLAVDLASVGHCACSRAALAAGNLPPVIMIAGADDGWAVAELLRSGADDFIRRDADLGNLVTRSKRLVARRAEAVRNEAALEDLVDAVSRNDDEIGPMTCRWERACADLKAALASERNLLRILIDQIPDLVYVKDRESRFIIANSATALLMGAHSANDLIGRNDHDYFPKEMADGFRADELEVLKGHAVTNREERAIDPLGTDRWMLTNKVPLRDESGTIIGLIGVGRDITLRRRAEDALRQSHAALKERQRVDTEEIHRIRKELKEKEDGKG